MEATKIEDIRETAASLFRETFPKNALIEVVVKPGLDREGDKILNVVFVFEELKTKRLDPGKINDFSWLVRRRVMDVSGDEDRFPMIEFANREDAKAMKIGTAA